MSDMKISVGFRWKTRMHGIVNAFCQIFINNIFYKILGNVLVLHLFPS